MKEKLYCAIYTRVSTDNQAEIEFNSCEAQKEKIEHFIKSQNGFSVYDQYNDEGYSGKDLNRSALQKMLGDISKGYINCVITYKMDRLTRSPKDFYNLIETFDKYGVDFISVTERFDTSTPSGRLLRNIMLTFAQFERELASERTKDKLLQRAQKGMWNGGTVPYGYRTKEKRLVIDKKEAEIIQKIFNVYNETKSIAKVYKYLKENNIKNGNGKEFTKNYIEFILHNILYTGKIKYADKLYQGLHKAIVTEELFNRVQTHFNPRKKKFRKYRQYPFKGLIRCGECGMSMSPCFSTKRKSDKPDDRYHYYRCQSTFRRSWDSCSIKHVSADRLENYIFDCLDRTTVDKRYLYSVCMDDPTSRIPHELNRVWGLGELEELQKYLKMFLKAAEKIRGTDKCHFLKNYVKDIVYTKETIQVSMYWDYQQMQEERILGQAKREETTRPQMECDKLQRDNRIGQVDRAQNSMEFKGGVGDGRRRSAEGRSAGGKASEAERGSYPLSESRQSRDERRARKQKELDHCSNDLVRVIEMALSLESLPIIKRIIPNTIHYCRKKNIYKKI